MVRKDGYVKVLDFGLAKLSEQQTNGNEAGEDSTKKLVKTNPGVVMGTAAYMSRNKLAANRLMHVRTYSASAL
jgi:serine/threonine protein kinase